MLTQKSRNLVGLFFLIERYTEIILEAYKGKRGKEITQKVTKLRDEMKSLYKLWRYLIPASEIFEDKDIRKINDHIKEYERRAIPDHGHISLVTAISLALLDDIQFNIRQKKYITENDEQRLAIIDSIIDRLWSIHRYFDRNLKREVADEAMKAVSVWYQTAI